MLSGAMDMIAVSQPDKTIKATTIKARFGSFKIINPNEKEVEVYVNNIKTSLKLRLSQSGEVYHAEIFKKIVPKDRSNSMDETSSNLSVMTNENASINNSPLNKKKETKMSPKEALLEEFNLNKNSDNFKSPEKSNNNIDLIKIEQKQIIVFDDNESKNKNTTTYCFTRYR